MRNILIFWITWLGITISGASAQEANMPDFSQQALAGKAIFVENCSQCHGQNALGSETGPPLLHPFYHPGHHSDAALESAIKNGVKAHHWSYGDMPPIAVVNDGDISKLIAFIRELQRANGIK